MSNKITLGKVITELPAQRDAVHICVFAASSEHELRGGMYVRLADNNTDVIPCYDIDYSIGVVDPFLVGPIPAGQLVWIFVRPDLGITVHHQWDHEAFKVDVNSGEFDNEEDECQYCY